MNYSDSVGEMTCSLTEGYSHWLSQDLLDLKCYTLSSQDWESEISPLLPHIPRNPSVTPILVSRGYTAQTQQMGTSVVLVLKASLEMELFAQMLMR